MRLLYYRMTTRFDYNRFYQYYTDPRNVAQVPRPLPTVQFFHNNEPDVRTCKTGATSVTINGETYYIKPYPRGGIAFTKLTKIPGHKGVWDNHYHFREDGLDVKYKQSVLHGTRQNAIWFHKTVQDPNNRKKVPSNCYFWASEPIDDITQFPEIQCLQTEKSTMKDRFPLGSDDLAVITELIRRPFYGVHYGGRGRVRTKTKGRTQRRTKTKGRGTRRARL